MVIPSLLLLLLLREVADKIEWWDKFEVDDEDDNDDEDEDDDDEDVRAVEER